MHRLPVVVTAEKWVAERAQNFIFLFASMSKQTRTIVLTVIATLFVVFALQNVRSIPVRVIVWTPSVPLVVLIGLVFLAGGVAGWFWRRR